MEFINWSLIKNPINWIIVVLMLIIFGMGADIILSKIQENK